jgi:hypothetical protein
MNTEKLVRTTFVLDRSTHEDLDFLSRRMAVSRSTIVRDLLGPSVANVVQLVRSVPDRPTEADLNQLVLDGLDIVQGVALDAVADLRRVGGG